MSLNSRRRAGFTLTEIAVTLGVVGFVLAAIWVAYASAALSYAANRMSKDVNYALMQFNASSFSTSDFPATASCFSYTYTDPTTGATDTGYWGASSNNQSQAVALANIAPPDMFSDPNILKPGFYLQNPWGQTALFNFLTAGACSSGTGVANSVGYTIQIWTGGMPRAACSRLLLENRVAWQKDGLNQLCAGQSCNYNSGWLGSPPTVLTDAQVATACSTTVDPGGVGLYLYFPFPLGTN